MSVPLTDKIEQLRLSSVNKLRRRCSRTDIPQLFFISPFF